MKLYGNELWNTATPNSEKSIFTVEKERVEDIIKILDEASINYCYYVKENKVTIALAKFAIKKHDANSLAKLPQFKDIHFNSSPVPYVPKIQIIGNTPYRDIKNRHFQNLNTDLALNVAERLNKAGINFSGRINGKNTTLTINDEDKSEFEGIVSDVINARQGFSEKIKRIDYIEKSISDIPEENRAIIQPLIDRAYYLDDNYLTLVDIELLEETAGYSASQLEGYVKIFRKTFEPWSTEQFLFADRSELESYKRNVEIENRLTELTYLKGFTSEQKESLREIIERDVPDSILEIVDYEFSAENIRQIPEIISGSGYDADQLLKFIADIKNIDQFALRRQLSLGTYLPETAEIDYGKFDVEHYSVFKNEKGSIYKIPIDTTNALLNRLADSGIVPQDECKTVYIETDGRDWTRIGIPDRFGNMTNNIDCFDVLDEKELKTMYQVYFDIKRIERNKQSAHEKNRVANVEISASESEKTTMSPTQERVYTNYDKQEIANQELQEQIPDTDNDTNQSRNDTLIVNIYGGPGAGKSTTALQLVAELKKHGLHSEYVSEVAKELVYAKNFEKLDGSLEHQKEIFTEQKSRLDLMIGNVDVAVTDSPLLLNTVYLNENAPDYADDVFDIYNSYNNVNMIVKRDLSVGFEQEGRIHNLQESIEKDGEIEELLSDRGIEFESFDRNDMQKIIDFVISKTYKKSEKETEDRNKTATLPEEGEAELNASINDEAELSDIDNHNTAAPKQEVRFNSIEFEKLIPHHMRFKEADLVNGNEMYWVTQGIFTVEDLREFQQAVKDYNGEIKKFYVTPRDLSTSYTFEDDKKKRVLATVTPDEIFTDDYVRAIMERGLADYLTPKNTDSLVTVSTENEPEDITLDISEEKTVDELYIGDKFDYMGTEYVVQSTKGTYPGDITVSYLETNSEGVEYEVTTNVNAYELVDNGKYLGKIDTKLPDIQDTSFETDEPQIAMDFSNAEVEDVIMDNSDKTAVLKVENFRITDSEIGSGTQLQRFNNNLAAIRTLKQIEEDGRQATPEEQEILSRYVGWGGLAEFFKETNPRYNELKSLLTDEEYDSARSTVLDSFYTSPVVIDSIYTVLQNAGFEGGNILEPSMGVGNFFGRMPQEMQEQSKIFGVEIDSLTGRIAKLLYPEAHIDIKGFEKTAFNNGSFDVAVGNIPFGDYTLQYNDQPLKIHDYFFMQTLDKVKDGGIVAFVTSKGTLDKKDPSFRKLLAERADLLGAVRLPNNAFKSAGTEVTADIIFLQKRSTPPEKMPEWVNIEASPAGYLINNYFIQHPDMILGEVVQGNKMYGRSDDTMCIPIKGVELSESLPQAVSKINAEFLANTKVAEPIADNGVVVPENLRNYSYFINGNDVYTVVNNTAVCLKDEWKRSYTAANVERAKAYIQIRDTVRELLAVQQETTPDTEEKIKILQEKLNIQYDNFYKKYGLLHSRFNNRLFNNDTSFPLMLSLEEKIDKKKLVKKSDIFYKRTIKVPKVVESVDTPLEALTLSVAEHGKIDFEYMSNLTSLPQETIIRELRSAGEIFPSPELSTENNIVYQTASEYLSGNIYSKIDKAKIAAEENDIFADNIKALEAVIPAPLKAGEIDIELGATWIPKEIYQQFMYETFKTPRENNANIPTGLFHRNKRNIEVDYSPVTNRWYVSNKSADNSVTVCRTYGTEIKNAYHIFEGILNLSTPSITKTRHENGKTITEMDLDATKLVQKKAEAIRKQFKDWIFKDPKRRKELVDLYNRQFNCMRPREYDGSNLQFHGMNAEIELHGHQKNAIAHAIYGGNTLFAHCVGAGKTYEMIATAMESKRLGLCSKSLFAVPNHLTEQVGTDFMKLYPNANILVATKKDFTKQNRSKLLAKIATGNYDAVIIGHSQLGMIPLSPERQRKLYKEQIREITEGIKELSSSDPKGFQVKELERTKKSLQKKLEKLNSGKKDDTVYFEELGIDKLFVDEAHEFKNLMCVTKLKNVSGISGRTSQRATELFMKCRYLDEKTGGKGIVFATGTPVSNSVTELHTMMRYLEYDFLLEHGLQNFDNWVSVFGKQKTDYELAPTGDNFKARTRIANYANMPELMTMFKQIADVKTADSLNLPVPECELHIVNAEPTELQKNMVQELSARADEVQTGTVDPHEDNMLKITGDGRKVGLDPRLIDQTLEDNPNTKLNQCVKNVFDIYQTTSKDKLTQIIFCDLGVPKSEKDNDVTDKEVKEDDIEEEKSISEIDSLEESGRFCIYDDIKNKLVAMGVPKNEIAFIHDAKTEAQKSDLFEKVRSGDVRVLIGSTAKMGTGTNVQDRLIALHDLDVPWRPADLEQRRGRMVRQGNINDKVHLYRYVTKGTFDAYSYQLLETKQRFISQVITSKTPARTCSDVDQESLTYSEIKALCTGDERIKEKLVLENRVKELTLFEKEYKDTHYELEDKVEAYPKRRQLLCDRIEKIEKDVAKSSAIPLVEDGTPVFKMTVKGIEYTNRKDAAEALRVAASAANRNRNASIEIGELYGFKISVTYDSINECIRGIVQGETQYNTTFGVLPSANLNKLEKVILGTDKVLEESKAKLVKEDLDIEAAKELLAVPFEFEQELYEKSERLSALTDELNAEAAERARSGAKAPKTHYFSKNMFLSSKKEAHKQTERKDKDKNTAKDKGVAI